MEFVIARNPDPASSLPYLLRLPIGTDGIALKARDTWPRTNKVYCHRADAWPHDLEIVERVPVRSCVRRGGAIDLVLDRAREHRSQFVFTRARGREVIFWQTARTSKQARPAVAIPSARASGRALEILVDSHERYAWKFDDQQATTRRQALPAGDYAVDVDGRIAQEWAYRFLGAAIAHHLDHADAAELQERLPSAGPLAPAEPTTADVRRWAREHGIVVPERGRLRPEVWEAYREANEEEHEEEHEEEIRAAERFGSGVDG